MDWAGLEITWHLVSSPRDRIRVRAVVANRQGRHLSRELPYCIVRLRLYRRGERVWDQGADGGCGGLRQVRLAPGEEVDFWSSVTAEEVLGGDVPAGDFLVRVHLPSSQRLGLPRAEMELTLGEITLRAS